MGIKLCGVLIDRDYQQDLPSLERILGVRLIPEGEVFWGDAWTNRGQGYYDVYFCEQGTLIYGQFAEKPYIAPRQRTLSFTWVESTNYYDFRYTEDGILRRAKVYNDGDLSLDEGLPLPEELRLAEKPKYEEDEDNTTELIRVLFRTMIGQSFDEIAPDSMYYRYRIVREVDEELEEDEDLEQEDLDEESTQSVRLGSYKPNELLIHRREQEEQKEKGRFSGLIAFLLFLLLFRLGVYIFFGV